MKSYSQTSHNVKEINSLSRSAAEVTNLNQILFVSWLLIRILDLWYLVFKSRIHKTNIAAAKNV